MIICLERGADLQMAQLMPLPLTVSCFSTFLVPAHPGSPGKRAVKRMCVWLWISTHLHSTPVYAPYTHSFNGPFCGTTWVSWYQKAKTNLDFTEARDSVIKKLIQPIVSKQWRPCLHTIVEKICYRTLLSVALGNGYIECLEITASRDCVISTNYTSLEFSTKFGIFSKSTEKNGIFPLNLVGH